MTGGALDVEHELLLIDGPLYDTAHRELIANLALLSQVDLLGPEEQLDRLLGGDGHGHGEWTAVADLEEAVFHLDEAEALLLHLAQVVDHRVDEVTLFVSLGHPNGVRPQDLMLGPVGQLYLLDAGCQGGHVIELQLDAADEVVEVALREAELDSLFVVGGELKAVDHFEHEKEGGRRTVGLFVFLLGQLPVGHDVPHDLRLVDGRLLQLLVLKIDYLEEPEHLGSNAVTVDAELLNDSLLDIGKGVI